jgi:hypothetical protein
MKEFVKKKAVIVMDSAGLPNYMTMFYMEPGTYEPEDVPELFKIRNKIVPAVLVSQFTNTMIKGVPASLPYQQPKHTISYDEAAAACGRKGKGWHLMTNTEFVYLLHEAEELGHTIGGNTNYGSNSKNEQESGVRYDSAGRTLTGCDPLTWSHDGTADGVFGLCGNFWEWVTGLRLHKGVVEYTPNNDAAVEGYTEKPDWTVAEVNGRPLKLYGNSAGDVVMSVAEEIEENWEGCHMADLQLEELEEMPEIAYKLGIVPHDWKNETAGIWADNELEEAVPIRGSSFYNTSNGGAGALLLYYPRSYVHNNVSFRSALFLESWELVTDLLKAGAEAHAGCAGRMSADNFPYVEGQPAEIYFDGKWHRGKIIAGYRFRDGIVTIQTEDGQKIGCGESRKELYRAL